MKGFTREAERASSVDVRTVGAGGGSIAHVPEITGALRVGPQSAGAEPGPAAYCKGGTEPTVTDANVALGYLPATARLGGDMVIDPERARSALKPVAAALGLEVEAAAEAGARAGGPDALGQCDHVLAGAAVDAAGQHLPGRRGDGVAADVAEVEDAVDPAVRQVHDFWFG